MSALLLCAIFLLSPRHFFNNNNNNNNNNFRNIGFLLRAGFALLNPSNNAPMVKNIQIIFVDVSSRTAPLQDNNNYYYYYYYYYYDYSKSFLRIIWRPMTIAKPLQVVCSPPKITSNFRPRVAYFQRRFGPMCPSSV